MSNLSNATSSKSLSKVKVLHLTFDMAIGGTEQVIRQIIEAHDEEISHAVLCIDGKVGEIGQLLIEQGVEVLSYPRKQGFDKNVISHIQKIIKERGVDVLHCHQYSPYFYGVLAAIFMPVRVIFTEHGRFFPDRYSWKRRLLNPILSIFTDSIVAISKATADALVRYEWFPARSIQVIYNGLSPVRAPKGDIEQLRALYLLGDRFVLGTVARLDPIKNHEMMLKGFSRVVQSNPNVVLIIVGDGPYRQETEAFVSQLDLIDNVIFAGFITNPSPYFGLIDVFLLPSLSEGTSMTLLEAMANGKPSVVTNVGGSSEIVEDGVSGLVCESDDIDKFVESINLLISEPDLYKVIKAGAELRFNSKFCVQNMTSAYIEHYKGP